MRTTRRTSIFLLVGLVATAVYWRTAYPTITWWDSSQYSLAASTMGVPGPPGSLLLTLLGWPLASVSPGLITGHVLNLFAGVLAAASAILVSAVALRILRLVECESGGADALGDALGAGLGAALGALTFAFSATQWEHAVKFTPYVLTTVFTGLILLTIVRWWKVADRPDSWHHIAVLGLLFGLDFSVHRTNALLIPGALAWIAIRNPHTLRQWRTWLVGGGSLIAGLAVQLLLIPIARATHSPLVWNDPTDLTRLWSYVSLERLGGGFLLQLFPRQANFWSVQTADFLRVLSDNFVHWNGNARALGLLSGVAGLFGATMLWRRDRRLGLAFTILLLSQSVLTVLYFNIPANFFRSFDRHYLPVCVTVGVAIACGLGVAMRWAADVLRARKRFSALSYVAIAVIAVLVPGAELADGWKARDASNRFFTGDYAHNALRSLPPNAIYFTVGDNDTFPVLYMQAVEGVRRDVQLVNLSLANAPEYADGLLRLDASFPLSMTRQQRRAETVGTNKVPADVVLLDIVRTNRWRRPLAFAITATGSLGWLEPYGRLDGLYWRIMQDVDPKPDPETLRVNLASNEYRGYANPSVVLDDVTRTMGALYYQAFDALLMAMEARGNVERCRASRAEFMAAVPPERLGLPALDIEKIRSRCAGGAGG